MSVVVSNTTTLNDLVGTIVSRNAQSAAYSNRVFRNLVRGEMVPPGNKSLTIPRFKPLTVSSATEGVSNGAQVIATDGVLLTPVEYTTELRISKMALHGDPFTDLGPYGDQIGRALAQKEDALIIAEANFTTVIGSGAMDEADFLAAIATLEANNAPAPYYAVFHPTSWAKLRSIWKADAYGNVGQQNVAGFGPGFPNMNSYVGSPYGIPSFITTQIATDGGATPSTRKNVVFSSEALGCAWIKDIGVDVDDNVVERAVDLIGWMAVDCAKLVDEYGVTLNDTLT